MHSLKIRKVYFDMIKSGDKTIECRLNDEKRQAIKIGDLIEIHENDNLDDKFVVRVIGLHYAKSFSELCMTHDCGKMGFDNLEDVLEAIASFYSTQQQSQYGVVGIEMERV